MIRRKHTVGWSHINMLMIACCFLLVSILCSTSISAQKTSSISNPNSRKRINSVPVPSKTSTPKVEKSVKTGVTKEKVKPTTSGPSITAKDCDRVEKEYIRVGFSIGNVLKNPVPGTSPSICGSSYTCCSRDMEHKLYNNIARKTQKDFQFQLRKSYTMLEDQEAKLRTYMHRLLNTSYNQLHEMFVQTYGLHYNNNRGVFVSFYDNMHRYLRGRKENITTVVNDFFREMCDKMVRMLHMKTLHMNKSPLPKNQDSVLRCLNEQFLKSDPYNGALPLIRKDLIRSLTAGRTLAMALGVQKEVLAQVLTKVKPAPECINALTRVKYCAICTGEISVNPCPNFCYNVVRGCYAPLYVISPSWKSLLQRVLKLVNLLESRNSLEHILENNLSVKISEAITNFQTKFSQLKETLYDKCRMYRPRKRLVKRRRRRRSVVGRGRYTPKRRKVDLRRLLGILKSQVLKPMLNILPVAVDSLCTKTPFQISADKKQCWNGTAVGTYEGALMKDTFGGQFSNPEVAIDVSQAPQMMKRLQVMLHDAMKRVGSAIWEKEVSVFQFSRTTVLRTARRGSLIEGSGTSPLPIDGSGAAPAPSTRISKPTREQPPIDDEVTPVKSPTPVLKGTEGSGAGTALVEGSGASPITTPEKKPTGRSPFMMKRPIPVKKQNSFNKTVSTTVTTTTTVRPVVTKPPHKSVIKTMKPPIDDVEGSGTHEVPKPERKLPTDRLPERKNKKKEGRLPVDEEVAGSGAGPTYRSSKGKLPPVLRQPDLEGSGTGSGMSPPQVPGYQGGIPDKVPVSGYPMPQPDDSDFPTQVWVPKEDSLVGEPSQYSVRGERNRDCYPKCTAIISAAVDNILLLLTVAFLSAAMLV